MVFPCAGKMYQTSTRRDGVLWVCGLGFFLPAMASMGILSVEFPCMQFPDQEYGKLFNPQSDTHHEGDGFDSNEPNEAMEQRALEFLQLCHYAVIGWATHIVNE